MKKAGWEELTRRSQEITVTSSEDSIHVVTALLRLPADEADVAEEKPCPCLQGAEAGTMHCKCVTLCRAHADIAFRYQLRQHDACGKLAAAVDQICLEVLRTVDKSPLYTTAHRSSTTNAALFVFSCKWSAGVSRSLLRRMCLCSFVRFCPNGMQCTVRPAGRRR